MTNMFNRQLIMLIFLPKSKQGRANKGAPRYSYTLNSHWLQNTHTHKHRGGYCLVCVTGQPRNLHTVTCINRCKSKQAVLYKNNKALFILSLSPCGSQSGHLSVRYATNHSGTDVHKHRTSYFLVTTLTHITVHLCKPRCFVFLFCLFVLVFFPHLNMFVPTVPYIHIIHHSFPYGMKIGQRTTEAWRNSDVSPH